MTVARSTQQTVEVLQSADANLRSTQQTVEVLQSADANLRSTQQAVEVLASADANLRSTQQVVEVLFSEGIELSASNTLNLVQSAGIPIEESASSTLSLSNTVERFKTLLSASSSLELEHSTSQQGVEGVTAENTMSLVQEALHNLIFESIANSLSLSQTLEVAGTIGESANSILELTQEVSHNLHFLSVSNVLDLQHIHTVQHNNNIHAVTQDISDLTHEVSVVHVRGISNSLSLSQSVDVAGPVLISASNTLALVQQLIRSPITWNRSLVSNLFLTDDLRRIVEASVASVLNLSNEVDGKRPVSNVLALAQTLVAALTKPASSSLSLEQALSFNVGWARTVNQNLGVTHHLTYLLEKADTDCQFTPFIGTGTALSVPILGEATLTLTYPFDTPTTTLVLRNPEFQNIDRFEFTRINRKSRGGEVDIFADSTWPKNSAFQVTVSALDETKKSTLVTFLKDSLGQEVGLLDHENRQWRGIITSPDPEITHVHRCNYSVSFTFEGELA